MQPKRFVFVLASAAVLAALLLAGPASAARPASAIGAGAGPASPEGDGPPAPGEAFAHIGDASNEAGDTSYLDNPLLNGNPGARFLAVNVTQPYGGVPANDEGLGIWYSGPQWGLYNEDASDVAAPRIWNVFVPGPDATSLIHVSTGDNTLDDTTWFSNTALNNHPEDILFVQHIYNPPAVSPNFFTPIVSLFYDTAKHQWGLFRVDDNAMPTGVSWVVVKPSVTDVVFKHVTSPANRAFNQMSDLDHPLLNGNPYALIFIQMNQDTGSFDVSAKHFGVKYDWVNGRWAIFTEDASTMPDNVQFNVLIVPPKTGHLVAKATIGGANVELDNPDLNGNPFARVYVMHNQSSPEASGVYTDAHQIGVFYSAGNQHWYIYNRDFDTINIGTTFNVYYTWPRADSSVVAASQVNTVTNSLMAFNTPLINNHNDIPVLISHNKEPDGIIGADFPSFSGVQYHGPDWRIFGGGTLPKGLGYNVLAPPAGASIVVTATLGLGGNILGGDLFLGTLLIDPNPQALMFASERTNANQLKYAKPVGVRRDGGHWVIFGEDGTPIADGAVFDVFWINATDAYLPLVRR